jgi:hypothetical protein
MMDASTMDFERAEPAAEAAEGLRCSGCGQPISGWYWQVNSAVACERCKGAAARERARRRPARFVLAGLLGTLAAAAGAGLYYAVAALTGYELGLIGIVVGLGVGAAVRKGGQGRGGWAYQSLAMFLTYMAIVSTYVPSIVTELAKGPDVGAAEATAAAPASTPVQPASDVRTPDPAAATAPAADASLPSAGEIAVAFLAVFGLAMALPFLAGLENLMGIAIIGFALYEAWKLNRAQPLVVAGPFDATAAAAGGAPSGG